MIQSFTPSNPGANVTVATRRSLPFQARSVTVSSGPNWVTLQPDGYVIPPGTVGLVYPLNTVDAIATFSLTAPPLGTPPLGPTQQQQSFLEYSDERVPANPGAISAPPAQPIAVQSGAEGALNIAQFFMSLAKAITIVAWTQDGAAHNFTIIGVESALVPVETIPVFVSNAPLIAASLGQGTSYQGTTVHLFPLLNLQCDSPYFYSARMYY